MHKLDSFLIERRIKNGVIYQISARTLIWISEFKFLYWYGQRRLK